MDKAKKNWQFDQKDSISLPKHILLCSWYHVYNTHNTCAEFHCLWLPKHSECIISWVVSTNGLGHDVPFAPSATKHFFTSLSLWRICHSCGDGRRARTALRLIWRVNGAFTKVAKNRRHDATKVSHSGPFISQLLGSTPTDQQDLVINICEVRSFRTPSVLVQNM